MFKCLLVALLTFNSYAGVIADTLYMECRNQSAEGRLAVATVIYNRAKTQKKSYSQVCLAKKQFSCWNSGYKAPVAKNSIDKKAMTEMVKIEKSILDGTFKPSGKWTHYHTTKVTPKWTKSMKDVAFVGNHKFGTIKG